MEKYSLEVENWGSYELVKDFSSIELAKSHGHSNFPQNEWRVFNRTAGRVVHKHDPFSEIAAEASQHLQRFADTDMWRQRFADQAASEVVARQQRSRLSEIAQRQRRDQRDHTEERRERLSGFRFNGPEPDILAQARRAAAQARRAAWNDEWGDEEECDDRLDLAREKVNWQQEGF